MFQFDQHYPTIVDIIMVFVLSRNLFMIFVKYDSGIYCVLAYDMNIKSSF